MDRIYLDYAATTPLAPEARAAMEPFLGERFGNASSLHLEGRRAKEAIDEARETLAKALDCLFGEVVFTSSGTEAVNLAILGTALANSNPSRRRVLVGAADHHCALHTQALLERLGYSVEPLRVDREARLDVAFFERTIGPDVLLVSLIHGNNEVGSLDALEPVIASAHRRGALVHIDAVQSFLTTTPWPRDADLVSVAAHKVYGPKGAGALRVRSGVVVRPLAVGGGQERELRAGTENVAAIVGFGAAVQVARPADDDAAKRAARDAFEGTLERESSAPIQVTGGEPRLAGHSHLRFPGLSAESVLIVLDRLGVAASSGAACSSGSLEPSHVLLACGYSPGEASEGLRFTFGRSTTVEQATEAARRAAAAANQVATAQAIA